MSYFKYTLNEDGYDLNDNGIVFKDVIYKNVSEKNKLDFYLPKDVKCPPVILFIHGGAFTASDKGRHIAGVLQGLQRGYAIASINFRLNNETIYPKMKEDINDAISFLIEQKDHPIDSDNIILWGETHGGYLATDVALDNSKMNRFCIRGVISFYAPYDYYDYYLKQYESNDYLMINEEIIDEKTFALKGKELLNYLDENNIFDKVTKNAPPFYLMHGLNDDNAINHKYTVKFANYLSENYVSHVEDYLKSGIHGIDYYDDYKYKEPIMRFIDSVIERGE